MALREHARFARATNPLRDALLAQVLAAHGETLNAAPWVHCGYEIVPSVVGVQASRQDVTSEVDSGFRLGPTLGFERAPVIVTTNLRSSRFAPILFWEVLHALAPGGTWIDVDVESRCRGTALCHDDFIERAYFRRSLQRQSRREADGTAVQVFRKVAPTPLAATATQRGWTFGILTSGPSARAARMANDLLALDLPGVEVIFGGPRPADVPDDPRVRAIDLAHPEPRGWITRKKNLLAQAATYDRLCLMHDRFVVTPEWANTLGGLDPAFSFLTVPQVFYADHDRRFPQRYADYQVLLQSRGVRAALDAKMFAGEHVLYAAYDDFYETAFLCGGLYIARQTLWDRVRQDESLFHCEWEDVVFGLQCQAQGMPHRVSRTIVAESLTPHPMALTRIYDMPAPDTAARGHLHVTSAQTLAARETPGRFLPVMGVDRKAYIERVVARFNRIRGLAAADRLTADSLAQRAGLAGIWRGVEERVLELPLTTRADIAEVLAFLSDTIYNWPNCEIQRWIQLNEQGRLRPAVALDKRSHVVGWGTGSLFRSAHRLLGRSLDFIVDSDPSKWDTTVDGVTVREPEALRTLNPGETTIVIFSCFVDAIGEAARAIGPFAVLPVHELLPERRFHPLSDLIGYFDEIDTHYPTVFMPRLEAAA